MDTRMIFDIGMHLGQDTAYYLHEGYRVIAVEANPLLAQKGATRFKAEIAEGRLIIENVGIAEAAGNAQFWICDEMSEWSSFKRESAARRGYKHHSIQVPCIRLPDLINKHGLPYYMKIDIEGHDRLCLQQLLQESSPRYISVESYGDQAISDLATLGYTNFKIIDQICFSTLEEPPTSGYRLYWALKLFRDRSLFVREAYLSRLIGKLGGRFAAETIMRRYRTCGNWVFEDGSSGPFAEETPGEWLSGDAAQSALHSFSEWFRGTGEAPEKRWFDIHAKK